MIREATEDTVLAIPNPPGEDGSHPLPVQKGAQVFINTLTRHNFFKLLFLACRRYGWHP
jgi:hypothetical protein